MNGQQISYIEGNKIRHVSAFIPLNLERKCVSESIKTFDQNLLEIQFYNHFIAFSMN